MRDIRKNQDYFKKYLDYQYSRIEKKTAKLEDCDNDKKQRVLVSLTGYEVDLLKAEFSAGATKMRLSKLLLSAVTYASEYKKITYEDLLVLLSMTVMLKGRKEIEKIFKDLIVNNRETINKDRLLMYIAAYIEEGKGNWDKTTPLMKDYLLMEDVFLNKDKEAAMLLYLEKWYSNHKGYAWYDSHLGDSDTYCGYWSFEAAAIAKILKLDEYKLKESRYYPTL